MSDKRGQDLLEVGLHSSHAYWARPVHGMEGKWLHDTVIFLVFKAKSESHPGPLANSSIFPAFSER